MRLQLIILLSILSSAIFAKPIYLRYESLSMDRYEYRLKDDNQLNLPFYMYYANTNDDSKLIFRTGLEKNEYNQNFSAELINLDQFVKSLSETNTLNVLSKDLYIVKEEKYGYNISKVLEINQLIVQNDVINFVSNAINFTYHNKIEANINLASDDSDYEVYYTDASNSNCFDNLSFRLVDKTNMTTAKGMKLSSRIGIVQQSLKGNNELELLKINNVPVDYYEKAICNKEDIHKLILTYQPIHQEELKTESIPTTEDLNTNLADNSAPISKSKEVLTEKNGTEITNNATKVVKNEVVNEVKISNDAPKTMDAKLANDPSNPCPPSAKDGIHVVQEGESLYAISKKLGLSVSQLRAWNNLTPDLILRPCMTLVVNEKLVPKATTENKPKEILTEKGGAAIESLPEWKKNTSGLHIVKSNETVESIAAKYGFTAERFRIINKLGNEKLTVGQELKINDCVCPTPSERKTEVTNEVNKEVKTEKIEAKESNNKDESSNVAPTTDIKILSKPSTQLTPKNGKKIAKVKYYVVKEEDTLISIAKKYKMTIEQIRKLNNLDEKDTVVPFQKLIVE